MTALFGYKVSNQIAAKEYNKDCRHAVKHRLEVKTSEAVDFIDIDKKQHGKKDFENHCVRLFEKAVIGKVNHSKEPSEKYKQ